MAGAGLAASGAFTRGIAEDISAITQPDQQPAAPKARKTMKGVPFERTPNVRVGIVGTGLRGRSVLNELLGVDGVTIVAICDTVPDKLARATKMITDKGQSAPATYTGSDQAFEQLVARADLDIVYTATPWEFHVPVMLDRKSTRLNSSH